jgi:hypothetical protein
MPNTLEEKDWNIILKRIKDGNCTPFIGIGACIGAIPSEPEIAQEWAKEHNYPLEDPGDLVRVAQFLAVTQDSMSPKEKMIERLKKSPLPDFKAPDEPHGVLADLPLPIYITTNYDNFMVEALKNRKRDPNQEICRWNKDLEDQSSIFESQPDFKPTVANPVVFHLHGHIGVPESLVLTQDDYLEFLINTSKDQGLIPPRIQKAFTGTSLLFMGYRIADWDFRVLFQSLVSYLGVSLMKRAHMSVQLVGDRISEGQKEKAQEYFDSYFEKHEIRMYWGTCRDFAAELKKRWEKFNK